MVTTPLMEEEVLEKLKTEDGIKEIKEQLLTSRQMPRHLLQPSGDSSPEQAVPCWYSFHFSCISLHLTGYFTQFLAVSYEFYV